MFYRVLAQGDQRLAEEGAAVVIAKVAALIGGSRALQAREREITARYTAELARLLAEEAGADDVDVEAWAVAAAQRAAPARRRHRRVRGQAGPGARH